MYSFRNDYSEGAHPQVLQALTDTNLVQTCGYGVDPICEEARDLIRTVCAAPEADVHFLVGGTQTNLTVITALIWSVFVWRHRRILSFFISSNASRPIFSGLASTRRPSARHSRNGMSA